MKIDFTKIDVEEFLNDLGIQKVRRKGNEVEYSCPFGTHRRGGAASMQAGTTIFNCFGCNTSGNAITFITELQGITPNKAKEYIGKKFDAFEGIIQEESILEQIKKRIERSEKRRNQIAVPATPIVYPILSEEEIIKREVDWWEVYDHWSNERKCYPFDYFFNRGFDVVSLEYWQIGWDPIEQMFTIPYRDGIGNLVGFKGRAFGTNEPRYKVLGGPEYGFETCIVSDFLFGLDKIILHAWLIVTEGELNTIAMHQSGITNVVGISGQHISENQRKLILENTNRVIFRFDDIETTKIMVKQFRDFIRADYIPYYKKDPADMTHEERLQMISDVRSGVLL